jgi:hypothetical protein
MVLTLWAQTAKEEISRNHCLSASNYLAYPGPTQKVLTPAPAGYHPFYISQYARHGSRYFTGKEGYVKPIETLEKADSDNALTPMGCTVLDKLRRLDFESRSRYGELTQLGAEQHHGIGQRLYDRFPEVFAGNADIEAKSTTVIRCILSMENELQQLLVNNPKLNIRHDASNYDMYYMNYQARKLWDQRWPKAATSAYDKWMEKHVDPSRVMARLFKDKDYLGSREKAMKLYDQLFDLASIIQNSEIRHELSLYDLFDEQDIYSLWEKNNIGWYIEFGHCPLNGAKQPFSQSNLLRHIISDADSCIATKRPGATLRFGHETMVLPLTCLLGLNGYDRQTSDLDSITAMGWINYKVFPMASNVQFVFYRKSPTDKDVLVKVLLNENEATLPFHSDKAPYYRWNDVKAYYLKKMDDAKF